MNTVNRNPAPAAQGENEKRDGKKERLPSWYNDEAVDDMWDSPEQGEMWDFPDPEEAKAQMAAVDVVVYSTQGRAGRQHLFDPALAGKKRAGRGPSKKHKLSFTKQASQGRRP